MGNSAEQTLDLVFKHGSALAEVSLLCTPLSASHVRQINPIIAAVFGIAKGAFEVRIPAYHSALTSTQIVLSNRF